MATPLGYATTFEAYAGGQTLTFPTDGFQMQEEGAFKRPRTPAFGSYSYSYSQAGFVFMEDGQISVRFEIWIDPTSSTTVTAAQAVFDAIAAAAAEIGQGKLFMTMPDGTRRWCLAEVEGRPGYAITEDQPYENLTVTMRFTKLSDWFASSKTAVTFSTPSTFTLTNVGNGRVAHKESAFIIRIRSNAAGAGGGFTSPVVITNTNTGESLSIAQASASVNSELKITSTERGLKVEYSNDDGASYSSAWGATTIADTQPTFFSLVVGGNAFTISGLVNASVEAEWYATWR